MRFGSLCKDTTAWSSAGLLIGTTASREVVVGQPLWAGVDAGKSDHYCVVIDADGKRLLSRRVANDEAALLELINAITALADGGELTWAIDLNAGGAALLIAVLIGAEQPRVATAARARPTLKTPR